jgi:Fe2+ transport system protein FeoA
LHTNGDNDDKFGDNGDKLYRKKIMSLGLVRASQENFVRNAPFDVSVQR